MNLGQMLDDSCKRFAGNIVLIHDGDKLTYRELLIAVNSLSNHLRGLGIQKGDKVAIMLPNAPEFIISYFAILKLGAVVVTLNTQSTSYELSHFLGNSDARALITTGYTVGRIDPIQDSLPLFKNVIFTSGLTAPSPFKDAVEAGPFTFEMPDIAGSDPAVMIYTSGLTGKPLGAVLTHHNLLTQSDLLGDCCECNETDCGLAVIPFYHAFGASANMLGVIKLGACLVLMDVFNIEGIFRTITEEKVTFINAVPRLFLGMVLHPGAEKIKMPSLKFCITGGSAMPPEFMPAFEQTFGVRLREGYGLTEASPICTISRIQMELRPGSIGTLIPGAEAKIVDDQGCEVPPGEAGELLFRGPNVMTEYYKDKAATAEVIKDGWLYTSDLARMDKDGFFYLTGRKKRMIITSGYNVYPREVEMVLNMHPAVKDSMVIGKEDLMRGEVLKALVIKKDGMPDTEKSILRHCRMYLSTYKVPRELEFVESFQVTD